MAFEKGRAKTGGRKKGISNNVARECRLVLEQSFEELGGVEGIVAWGKQNPTEFYRLWAKLIPRDIAVPTTLDIARALLTQLEKELGLPPSELNVIHLLSDNN